MFKFALIYSFLGEVCYTYTQAESLLELKKDRIARYKRMNEDYGKEAIKLLDIVQIKTYGEAHEAYLKHLEFA